MIKTRLIRLLSHAGKYIVYHVLWQWLALVCQIVVVFSVAGLLESAAAGTLRQQDLLRTAAVLAAAVLIRFGCDKGAAHASFAASVDVKRILREKIYDKLLRLGASYREQTATSEVVQMAAEGVEQLETYFGKYLSQLCYSLLAPVTLFAVLSFVSLKASVILLICVPLIPVSIVAVQKFAKKLLNRYWGIYTGLGDSFLENLQGLTTLKIYQADGQKAQEMDREAEQFRKITMKVLTMQLNSISVMDIVAYGGAAAGMIVAVGEYLSGRLTFAGALTMLLLASEFFIPLRLLGSFFHIAMNGMAASDKIFRLLDLPEPERGVKATEGAQLKVMFENVGFSYEENREILKHVSLELPAGSLVSLVGESGCGKSTVAAVLTGRNRGYQGSVCLGGVELSEISEAALMRSVTRVAHNSYLFKGTVEENLRMGCPDAGREEMIAVLKKVNLWGFLQEQEGLETRLQERGSNLSSGQCQRLALARALLHDTPVYIFDEATSNIDVESEEMIMEVIRDLAKTRTVLLISHRLANVVTSGCIYMMVRGEIVESGTHEELMSRNGKYRKLFDSQRQLEDYGSRKRAEQDGNRGRQDSAAPGAERRKAE